MQTKREIKTLDQFHSFYFRYDLFLIPLAGQFAAADEDGELLQAAEGLHLPATGRRAELSQRRWPTGSYY